MKTINSDFDILNQLVKIAEEKISSENTTWSNKVEQLLLQNYTSDFLKIEDIADLMFMTKRTLQRHLSNENTSFTSIKEKVKYEMAQFHLSTNENIKSTAKLIGFSNNSNFTKAFTKWSGIPPNEYNRSIENP